MTGYNILIGDDHELIRNGLKDLLVKLDTVAIVDTAGSEADLLASFETTSYDIVFVDIHFGKHDGRETAMTLRNRFPSVVLAALTSFDDKDTIQSTINTGFNALFLKSDEVSEIAEWIRRAEFDALYLSMQTKHICVQHVFMKDNKARHLIHLTEREKEILRLILDECTTKQIAQKMFLSEKTIESYRSGLMQKLDVTNIAGLVKKTILFGLLR